MPIKILDVPVVNTEQMREVDRLLIEKYHIHLLQTMENAGRNLAEFVRCRLDENVAGKRIAVLAGRGNNGGGGRVAARHLSNWGAEVLVISPEGKLAGEPLIQQNILQELPVKLRSGESALPRMGEFQPMLLVDALLGFGISGPPRGFSATAIRTMNAAAAPVVSLDVPSGLEPSTGQTYEPCVRADSTLTLALPKTGLLPEKNRKWVGNLYVVDIGVPPELYRLMGLSAGPIFGSGQFLDLQSFVDRAVLHPGRPFRRTEQIASELENNLNRTCIRLE